MSIINGPADGSGAPKGSPQRHYRTMTLAEIIAAQPPIAVQAHLYIWCLAAHADWGFTVARAWGGEPVTMWTWHKPGLGVGRFRCNTEHIVVARVGSRHGNPFGAGGRAAQATDGTCFNWPRGAHSEKPDGFYALVEQLSPGPRLDMYARVRRAGWYAFGDEVDGSIQLAATSVLASHFEAQP